MNFVLAFVMPEEARAAAIHDINAAIETGALRPFIGHRFALSELAAAHDAQDSGEVVGNFVIDVADGSGSAVAHPRAEHAQDAAVASAATARASATHS